MAKSKNTVAGWGDLNMALNGLVRAGTIVGYKTSRPENGGAVGVEVTIATAADQADVVRLVRDALPHAFSGANVRTRAG